MPIVSIPQLASARIDYVIAGGGTAGLTLAARLTEDSTVNVLVIEAGGFHKSVPEIDIPGMLGRTIANPDYDWTFLSVPQKRANNRVVLQHRGKGLGGSSLINFLGMFRPSKTECDALEKLGNTGWNWDSLLHYMKKVSETTFLPSGLSDDEVSMYAAKPELAYHGTNGPIMKSMPLQWTGAHAKLFDAAESLDIFRNQEPGSGINIGCMSAFSSVDPRNATRSNATTAYLSPNLKRKNLLVLIGTQVTRIIFDSEGESLKRATGVEVLDNDGILSQIKGIKKDVILSAGTLQTPNILELSGIGNPEILSQHNIPCIINLPGVGENLQDHVSVTTIAELDPTEDTFDVVSDPALLKEHEELYKHQRGHFAYGPCPAYIFLPAKQLGTPEGISSWVNHARSTLTDSLAKAIASLKSGLEKQYKMQEEFIADTEHAQTEILQFIGHPMVPNSVAVPGKRYTALLCALMHPLSRGSVHISSRDPLTPPAIDPNYFANEADLDILTQTVKLALQLYKTTPLKEVVRSQVLPPPEVVKDDMSLREYIRDQCANIFHPVGTASMLSRDDGGVVDCSLKVYGTSNLRVVDLSILPLEISAHTQAIAYGIGEKAADILKAEARGA